MRSILSVSLVIFILAIPSFGQDSKSPWEKLDYLIGFWEGEGSGQLGAGSGSFTFDYSLDKNIVIRKSHSEYPAMENRPAIVHDDLMIIYLNPEGNPERAIYFDNEKHVIHYSITAPGEKDIVFTSDKIPNAPFFRLTYTKLEADLVNVKFEMSQDGESFTVYLEGKSIRKE